MLDKINNQLSTIKQDITNIKSNVTELEKGSKALNEDAAEMKESMKWKADLKQLPRPRKRSRRSSQQVPKK